MCRRICSLVLILALVWAMALPVCAHEVPDPDRLGSITVTMAYEGEPVPGGRLTLFRVADVVSDDGDYLFAYTPDFAGCSIPLAELSSAELPEALAEIAAQKNLQGVTQIVDEAGKAVFADLKNGLYLLVQEEAAPGYRRVNPFLVSVPQYEEGRYIYDVETAPKNEAGPEPEPTEPPPPTEPDGPDLPQTGQLNWPVPVLAVLGMLLVVAGFALCTAEKRKNEN